jgi:hypothetical protein
MSLAFVLVGLFAGLAAGLATWIAGAGLGLALLAYVGCGTIGMLGAVALGMTSHYLVGQRSLSQPHT